MDRTEDDPRRGSRVSLVLRAVISLGLLAYLLSWIDFKEFWIAVSQANVAVLGLVLLLYYPVQLINIYKWKRLLVGLGQSLSLHYLFRVYTVGLFYGLFLPGQVGGEIVKGWRMIRQEVAGGPVVLSILYDKITGLVGIGLIAAIGLLCSSVFRGIAGLAWGVSSLLAICVLGLLAMTHPTAVSKLSRLKERWDATSLPESVMRLVRTVVETLQTSTISYSEVLVAVVFSALFQLSGNLVGYGILWAMGIPLPFWSYVLVNSLVAVIQLLPISISGLGIREGLYVYWFGFYGIPASSAVAFSLVAFSLTVIVIGIGGGGTELLAVHYDRRVKEGGA